MRRIAILLCSVALVGGVSSAQAQAKTAAPQGAAHLVLPPVPKALLPESFPDGSLRERPKR